MKHRFYRCYILIAFLVCIPIAYFGFRNVRDTQLDLALTFTILGGIFSSIYFVQKQRIAEIRLFKDLFNEFNEKYDQLNEDLNQIWRGDDNKKLRPEEINRLYDYFNLCGEEYLYYREGYIYPEVWKAWCNGMKYFLDNKRIRDCWLEEEKTNSYYGLTLSIILKSAGNR